MADWQYTSWGWTPDQVFSSLPADSEPTVFEPSKETPFGDVKIAAHHTAVGKAGYVSFAFLDDRLSAVMFAFVSDEHTLVLLQDHLGVPVLVPDGDELQEQVWMWRREASGDNVRYIRYPASLFPDVLVYTPIMPADASGL